MTPPTTTPTLPADLEAGLKRLKLAAIRHAAPEILLTAKTQRWKPEETLRVLIDLEITARDQSNMNNRMKAARFPVVKTLDEFNIDESSIPKASHDYLVTLDWIDRADNLCLVGPAGTGKSHYLIAVGRAAIEAGHRVRYFTAAELIEHLWRATADNTVGRTIEQLCRNQLLIIDEIGFAPLDHTGCQLLFRLVAAAYEKRSLAIGSHT
ncbi:MAG: ATP-binding protein, partial [Acidimicrobiia bacterium]|nr:ATP-binding protein [Acidimicrobiia bacterium]